MLEEEVPTELKVLLTLTVTLTSLLKHTTEDPALGCLSRRCIVVSTIFPYQKSVRTHATKHATNRIGKMILKNCQILENVLGISSFPSPISRFPSPKIQFPSPKIQFSLLKIQFTQIGFLLSSTDFRFLQRLSDFLQRLSAFSNGPNFSNGFPVFLNGFLLSKKSKNIYLWQEVYERLLFELHIFCHLLPELRDYR
jgi:hypothetical protein